MSRMNINIDYFSQTPSVLKVTLTYRLTLSVQFTYKSLPGPDK